MSLLEYAQESFVTVKPEASVEDVVQLMRRQKITCVVVMSGAILTGILTERDVERRIYGQGHDPRLTRVADAMSSPVVTVQDDMSLSDALEVMRKRHVKQLPVTNEDGLIRGILPSALPLRIAPSPAP